MTALAAASERDLRVLAGIISEDRPDVPAEEGLPPSLLACPLSPSWEARRFRPVTRLVRQSVLRIDRDVEDGIDVHRFQAQVVDVPVCAAQPHRRHPTFCGCLDCPDRGTFDRGSRQLAALQSNGLHGVCRPELPVC
jgi:hypothetical protein